MKNRLLKSTFRKIKQMWIEIAEMNFFVVHAWLYVHHYHQHLAMVAIGIAVLATAFKNGLGVAAAAQNSIFTSASASCIISGRLL